MSFNKPLPIERVPSLKRIPSLHTTITLNNDDLNEKNDNNNEKNNNSSSHTNNINNHMNGHSNNLNVDEDFQTLLTRKISHGSTFEEEENVINEMEYNVDVTIYVVDNVKNIEESKIQQTIKLQLKVGETVQMIKRRLEDKYNLPHQKNFFYLSGLKNNNLVLMMDPLSLNDFPVILEAKSAKIYCTLNERKSSQGLSSGNISKTKPVAVTTNGIPTLDNTGSTNIDNADNNGSNCWCCSTKSNTEYQLLKENKKKKPCIIL